ncbi:MAG: hypothetical protein ACE15F_14225 [bacterium]
MEMRSIKQINREIKKLRLEQAVESVKKEIFRLKKRIEINAPPVILGLLKMGVSDGVLADFLGISRPLVCHWRNGIRRPSPHFLIALNHLLGLLIQKAKSDFGDTAEFVEIFKTARAAYNLQHDEIQGFPASEKIKAEEFFQAKTGRESETLRKLTYGHSQENPLLIDLDDEFEWAE